MKILDVPQTGKLGLTVTYPGRNGLIRRIKVSPKNPQTGTQIAQRSGLKQCAQAYDQLTDAQQKAWVSAALKIKSRPTLGQGGPLTGLQLFVRINAAAMTTGAEMVQVPPAVPAPQATGVTGVTVTAAGGVVTKIELVCGGEPPENTMLWGCAPQYSGVTRPVGPRYLGTLNAPVAGKIDITAIYVAKFGAPPLNSRVFVQVNTNQNGWEGLRETFNARVPQA